MHIYIQQLGNNQYQQYKIQQLQIYKQKTMLDNSQSQSHHLNLTLNMSTPSQAQQNNSLLQWLNMQRTHLGKPNRLFNIKQIIQQGCIEQMLGSIDPLCFKDIQGRSVPERIQVIQGYMNVELGKRMKVDLKNRLTCMQATTNMNVSNTDMGTSDKDTQLQQIHIQYIQLICYICIHSKSPTPNSHITRIMTLSETTQQNIIHSMQQISQKLMNISQLKQIISYIQKLELQNECLKQKLEEINKINVGLGEYVKEQQLESDRIRRQADALRKQKYDILHKLNVSEMSDYVYEYNKIKQQNQRYYKTIQEIQDKLQQQTHDSQQYLKRIKYDCIIINNLSEQVSKLKKLNLYNFDSHVHQQQTLPNVLVQLKNSNKQNMNITKQDKSKDNPRDPQTKDQLLYYRTHNEELMGKLQNMYTNYTKINKQITTLRQQNQKLVESHLNLQQIMRNVYKNQKSFQFKFKYIAKSQGLASMNQYYKQKKLFF